MKLIHAAIIGQGIGIVVLAVLVGLDMSQTKHDINFLYNERIVSQNQTDGVLEILKMNTIVDSRLMDRIEDLEAKSPENRNIIHNQIQMNDLRFGFISVCSDKGGSTTIDPFERSFTCHNGRNVLYTKYYDLMDDSITILPNIKSVSKENEN